jgi:hypothetical protein
VGARAVVVSAEQIAGLAVSVAVLVYLVVVLVREGASS